MSCTNVKISVQRPVLKADVSRIGEGFTADVVCLDERVLASVERVDRSIIATAKDITERIYANVARLGEQIKVRCSIICTLETNKYIIIDNDIVELDFSGGAVSVTIRSNTNWTVEYIKEWEDGGTLYVTYEGNGDGEAIISSDPYEGIDRETTITFKGGGKYDTLKVRQEGTRQQFVTADELVFRCADGGMFGVLNNNHTEL